MPHRIGQEPDRADFLRNLSVSYERMGDLLRDLGQGEQACAFFQKDLEIAEHPARQEPDRADFQLIWLSRSITSAIIDRRNGRLTSSCDSTGNRS